MSFLCGLTQNGGPLRHRSLREVPVPVVAARHARVQVDLLVSRIYAIVYQSACFSQGGNRCFLPPWEGTKVIPSEQDALCRQSGASCSGMNELGELAWRQTGVAAKLVDLA